MTPEEERRLYGKTKLGDVISPHAKEVFEELKAIDDPAAKELYQKMEEATVTQAEVMEIAGRDRELLKPARDGLVIAKALDLDCKDLVSQAEHVLDKNPAATDEEIMRALLEQIASGPSSLTSVVAKDMLDAEGGK